MAREPRHETTRSRHTPRLLGQQGGFSLAELLVVLMILALLVGIVSLNTIGFLRRARESAFKADRHAIQAAVTSYYTDPALRAAGSGGTRFSTFPTDYSGDGVPGLVTRGTNVIISMPLLLSKGYLRAIPDSASKDNGGQAGRYVWIIDSRSGTVYGCPHGSAGSIPHTWNVSSYDADCAFNGQYP